MSNNLNIEVFELSKDNDKECLDDNSTYFICGKSKEGKTQRITREFYLTFDKKEYGNLPSNIKMTFPENEREMWTN